MKKNSIIKALILLMIVSLTSCLTVEKKEYSITLKSDGSGSGTIKYINIFSQKDEDKDVSEDDFATLIADYYEGETLEEEFPDLKNLEKKLFIENGVLCGELKFDFDNLAAVKIFRYDDNSPFMHLLMPGMTAPVVLETNGDIREFDVPIIFWNKTQKEFTWTEQSTDDLTEMVNLTENFKKWEAEK